MKCNDVKLLMMDFLYDEISEEDKKIVQTHLSQCSECKRELSILKQTSTILQKSEDVEPNMNLVFVRETNSGWSRLKEWVHFSPKRLAYGFAFGLASIVLFMSLINTEITYKQGDFSLKMNLLPHKTEQQPSIANQNEWMAQLQQQNLQMVSALVQQSEERQRQQLISTLTQFSRDFENRRTNDLQLVGAGLGEIEKNIYSRVQQRTNSQFNDLIRYINAQQGRKE